VALTLVEGRTPELLDRLVAGEADLAVVSSPPAEQFDRTKVRVQHLIDEQLLVAVSRRHRLARRRVVHLPELADDSFIVGSASAEESLMRASFPPGFRPRVDVVVADWIGKLGCVAAGLGVALLPALAARAVPADVALLRLTAEHCATRSVFTATAAGRTRTAAADALVTDLDRSARDLRGLGLRVSRTPPKGSTRR
jgi:DNA-binding transcriptional LysR family regulator